LLFAHFIRLQNSAGVEPRLKAEGQWYGFHDLRRGFATNNYQALSALELTQVMQHRDLSTTKRYINMAEKYAAAETTAKIFVPDVLQG
jgi:integrase